jgi:trans-aconitate methyltransferase
LLDVGCGVGSLASHLASIGYAVTAIDSSAMSVKEAANQYVNADLEFLNTTVEEFGELNSETRYPIIVANMTLHCVPDLARFLIGVRNLLTPNGFFIAALPNPRTYLQTREDLDVANVDLSQDATLEIPFRIRNHIDHPARVFYFHRPVRKYTQTAAAAGLTPVDFLEPSQIGPGRPRDVILIVFQNCQA